VSKLDPPAVAPTIDDRLSAFIYARREYPEGRASARAASDLIEALRYLDMAGHDVDRAETAFHRTATREQKLRPRPRTEPSEFEWLVYRIDTMYVFARTTMDNIAVLIDATLGPAAVSIGSHTRVSKNLPALAESRGLQGSEAVVGHAKDLTKRVKYFRDDYVVHRALKKPRALRGLSRGRDGRYRLNVGGLRGGLPGEEPKYIVSEPPEELIGDLTEYVGAVLDLVEQWDPRRGLAGVDDERDRQEEDNDR
jgi:hypothetical protein